MHCRLLKKDKPYNQFYVVFTCCSKAIVSYTALSGEDKQLLRLNFPV
jgi:hypothetical protein